jgi:uncharacterized protein YcnI
MKHIRSLFTLGVWLVSISHTAHAHILLTEPQAVAGNYYKATLRVGHGCNGAATHGLVVQVPAGFQSAKPQPKVGWVITTRKAKLSNPYSNHGKTVTDDVVELRWTANPKSALPDDQFDEFAFMGRLPDQAGPLWIKILQICETGQNDWSEIPVNGTSTRGLKLPAALLDVQTAPKHEHHH